MALNRAIHRNNLTKRQHQFDEILRRRNPRFLNIYWMSKESLMLVMHICIRQIYSVPNLFQISSSTFPNRSIVCWEALVMNFLLWLETVIWFTFPISPKYPPDQFYETLPDLTMSIKPLYRWVFTYCTKYCPGWCFVGDGVQWWWYSSCRSWRTTDGGASFGSRARAVLCGITSCFE